MMTPTPLREASPKVDSRERALWEKEVLGFQFGDHPFMEAAAWLAGQLTHDTSQVTAEVSGEKIKIAGLVTGVRRILTKSKSQMAVIVLEDLHGAIEAVAFPRVYERLAGILREDLILVIEGKVDTRSERPQIVIDRAEEWTRPATGTPPLVSAVSDAQPSNGVHRNGVQPPSGEASGPADVEATKRILRVVVPRDQDDNACIRVLERLHVLVVHSPGPDTIQLVLYDRAGTPIELTGADISVKHSTDLESQVRTLVGEANLEVVGD
jgi:hypothetical protein